MENKKKKRLKKNLKECLKTTGSTGILFKIA